MTAPRVVLMLLACLAAVCAIAATHVGSAPSRSTYWKTICYLGGNGQPGGCVQVWVNTGPVPQ